MLSPTWAALSSLPLQPLLPCPGVSSRNTWEGSHRSVGHGLKVTYIKYHEKMSNYFQLSMYNKHALISVNIDIVRL